MNKELFGAYISNLRKSQGITQAELAKKINVTDKAISKWERGIGLPDISNIEPLANALGVSVLEIMKSEKIQEDSSSEQAVTAIKNTISLAKLQKRRLCMKIASVLMIYIAIKGVYTVFFSNSTFDYSGLPMVAVYLILLAYIIATGIITVIAFKKNYSASVD